MKWVACGRQFHQRRRRCVCFLQKVHLHFVQKYEKLAAKDKTRYEHEMAGGSSASKKNDKKVNGDGSSSAAEQAIIAGT